MASSRDRSSKARDFRRDLKANWQSANAACGICGQATIDWDGPPNESESFELDHKKSIKKNPELEFDPSNAQPSHHRCNRGKGSGEQMAGLGTTSEAW